MKILQSAILQSRPMTNARRSCTARAATDKREDRPASTRQRSAGRHSQARRPLRAAISARLAKCRTNEESASAIRGTSIGSRNVNAVAVHQRYSAMQKGRPDFQIRLSARRVQKQALPCRPSSTARCRPDPWRQPRFAPSRSPPCRAR
jgi:hypothetical protein